MIEVTVYSKSQWSLVSEAAHKVCFSELKPASLDRIDFALVPGKNGIPSGYITCRELDSDTLYFQFGGAFPGTKDSLMTWEAYLSCIEWCRPKYKRITTLIENTNTVMLKMAMKAGFRISGVKYYKGVLVEHLLEFSQ